jgi:hypothetical protein
VARPPADPAAFARRLDLLTATLRTDVGGSGAGEELVRAAAAGELGAAFAAADRMVGLGPGLTPSGDDLLCGFLVTLHQLAPPGGGTRAFAAALGRLVATRAVRATTALSATLLGHAARGEAPAEVVDVLTALGQDGPGDRLTARALPRLLAVGHTSGRDLALGVAAACHVLLGPLNGAVR